MARIAILAFGSLIEDPGKELHPRIRERIEGIKMPFSIEFARSSGSRFSGRFRVLNISTLFPITPNCAAVSRRTMYLPSH